MNIAQVRAQYPQYQDLSDKQLADALHAKFYSDIPIQDYYSRIGLKTPEKESILRQVADVPVGIAKGAVQGVRMMADAFGAGSDTSKTIKSAETYLSDLMSAQAKNDQQEISRIMKDAEDKGALDQVKAAVKAFSVAPVDTLSSALGTAAPVIVGALGAKVLGAGTLIGTGVSALMGAGMGAGTIKGSIYEETKNALKEAGASEQDAETRAKLAQEYNGKNLDQILLGTVLGGAAALGPLEKGGAAILARRILGKTGVEATESVAEQAAKGAIRRRVEAGALEAIPEAVQAGQEQVAQNIALQREGFEDVPTFRGAVSAATLEALAGAGLGATIGGGRPEVAPAPEPAPAPKAPDLEAPRTGPLTPEEQIELERQRAAAERPKTTEELLAETGIQTGRPTTAEDIARIRDEHETAVIEGLLAQDAEMKRANELASLQREQQRQQTQLESEAEAIAGGISDIDSRVREGRIFSSVQDLIDRNIPFASTAINDINQKFGVINEAPLNEEERTRIENIMGMVNTFTNFVNLPVLAPKPVDRFAENQAMEALIKERTERGPTEPLRAAPPAPSPRIEEAPVSQGVGEGATLRPTGGVEPSVAEDRERVAPTPPTKPTAFESQIVSRQPAPDGMEVHVFATTDGYGTGLFDADAGQYVDGSITRFAGADTLPKAQERAAEMLRKATPVETPSPFMQRLQEYWKETVTPAVKNYLDAFNSFGVDRLEANQIKPSGMSAREWLESFVSKQSTWDKGRKTGETGIQALSTKNLWPTTDGSGERLRKAMLDAVKAIKNAPGSTSELVDQAFGKSKLTTTAAPKVEAPVTPAANVEEQTTPTEEAKNIVEPTIRSRLKEIARNLGVLVFETGDKYSSGNGVVNIPTEDKQVEGAQSPEHVFAHELGHAILQNRSMSFNGMPNAEVAKWITGWDGIKAISKAFRPEIHNHKLPKFRRHANKPDEIIADALGSFLLGNSSKQDIAPLIKALNLNDFDLGIKARPVAAEVSAPKAEAPAVEAPTAKTAAEAPVGVFRRATAREANSDNAQFVYDVGNGARLLFVPSQNGDVYVAAPGKGASLVVRTGDNRDNVIKTVDQFPDYIPENIRQIVLDYHKAVQGKTTDEEQTAVAMEMAEKIEAITAPKAEAPAAPPTLDTTGIKEVKGRHPQVQAAAKLLQDKKMTREEFEKYVDYYKPIQEVEAEKLLPPTSEQRMNETVNADKRDKINVPVADGTKVGLRMDLPARDRGGAVVSIQQGNSGKLTVGKLISFRSTGWLKDVTFEVRSQEKGLAVATGAAKAPLQTAEGTWFNLGPEETYARVKELMKDPAWKQIGFDPSRHGYFYDRKTREPVVSASEMYQVGQFLLAKDVQYAPKENYLYSIEPTVKSDRLPSYKRGVENLRKRWDKGELTSDEFATRVDILARQIENAELTRELPARERGADYIRQRLLEAKRRGELTAEAVDFAEWFILQNPKLVDDLAISIRTPKEGGVAGSYESVRRLMTLMKDNSSDYTAVHEILHHLERMMPKDVQSAIRKVWFKSLVEAQKKAKTEAEKTFFENIMEYHFGMGGNTYLKNALDAIKNGNVDKSFYQYSSPSEFWAENGSEIMGNRFLMQGSVLKKLKQWLREVAEKAKDLFGLNSKAPIIRALDSLSKGDGKFVTSTLLDETTEPKLSVTEKVTAAAQKALQKQPVPEKGLSHVSKDLVNLTQPIFFPQNKTIIDRIEGMKDRFWQRLAQKTADQFRTIKEYSPTGYMQARLSKSIDGSLEGLLFHGQVFDDGGALNIKKNTKGMMDILKPIGNELDSYLMWVALNREARLPEDKRSKIANMDQLVARRSEFAAGELNGKPRVEVYQDVLRQMNQLNKSVLDIALAKGLIDQKGYDKFSNDIYYIPFYKKMEEDGTIEGAQTASGLTSQYFSKELKGSEAPFGDLMENIVRNWSHILSASMKNAAAKTTIDDAMKLQAAEPNLKAGLEMRDGVVYSTKSDKPIEAKFDEDGKQIYAEGELRPDLTTSGTGMAKIMVDGQPMYFKVTDDLLMDSISSIGYMGPKSKFLDVARNFKNMLQYGVTASPIFKVNNLIRDSVSALAVSDLKKSPVSNVMKGISLSKPDSPTYISALAGGAIFNFGSAYEGDQAKLIKRLIDQGVEGDTILDSKEKITKALKKTWDAYQHLGDRSEAANRLALYQQLRDKGMSHLEASFMARDLLDFSMQGSWPAFRLITQVVPFMNARIQGLYKLGRDGINPTVRVLYNATTGKEIDANDKIRAAQFATVSAAVMLASALLYLTFKDDEDFKKRDAWDRDNFWWFKIPSLDIAFRVPKPFEVGAFGTLVERSLEQILDQGAEGKTFADSLKRTLWDTFALNPTPQMFKPLFDLYANKDSFSGAPIESAGLERLSKQERMTEQTSPLAIALSKVWSTVMPEKVESSPVQMDYAIKGYLGWLGAMASMASTYAVMPFKEGEYPDARWLDRASLGLVRDLPAPQSAYVTAFYENAKEISQAYADMRHYREMGDAEKVQEILEKSGDKIALAKFYDKTSKNIANVRKQIQFITNDKTLDGATKKEEIERMKLIMSDLAKQAEEVRKSMKP